MTETHYPWMDLPTIPDPIEVKQCQVRLATGVRLKDYTDYGPFRRCGCKRCVKIVEKYDRAPVRREAK